MLTLETGCLAYYDCFTGFIPCWITAINGPVGVPSTAQRVTIKITARKGAYKRGEVIETSGIHVVPRGALRRGKYCTTIRPYEFGHSDSGESTVTPN